MTGASFALILTGVLLNAAAQLLLKAGANRVGPIGLDGLSFSTVQALAFSGPIVAGLACYVVSVVVWIVALSRVEVSIAYPMLSIGYVVNAVAAWMLFGEALSPMRFAGIAVIIFGVFLLAASGRGA
ncbi:MAG TPA: SMR family transporter [Burkholderiales bacterium]|jgi:multidrug transporter EmrE-like cation transporter|nr:SMR family transporter [Burkholderiales bacterium]